MNLEAILLLAALVAGLAYALGTLVRRREGGAPPAPPPARAPLKLFGGNSDREAQAVVNWLLTQAFEQTGVKVADDKVAYQRIVEAAHKALQELKAQPSVTISLPFLTADSSGPKHFEIRLNRDVIKELARY